MTTIVTTKDAMAAAKTRMEKAVDDFRKELATRADRARQRRDSGSCPRGLSRHAHAGESTGHA